MGGMVALKCIPILDFRSNFEEIRISIGQPRRGESMGAGV